MRIVLMHFLNPENTKHSQIIRNLVDSASKKGHTVEVIDGQKDLSTFRFTPYEYIALLTPTLGFLGGKVPPIVSRVTPGRSWTSASRVPVSALNNVDFPVLGRPAIVTFIIAFFR